MKRSPQHNKSISIALKGKCKSIEHRLKMSESAKKRLSKPENNPNYKGNSIGYIGIHIWLRKTFGYPEKCEACSLIGSKINNKWNIVYAKIIGQKYERKRENFICLCNKCHRNYDKDEKWNRNISKGKMGIKRNKLITL